MMDMKNRDKAQMPSFGQSEQAVTVEETEETFEASESQDKVDISEIREHFIAIRGAQISVQENYFSVVASFKNSEEQRKALVEEQTQLLEKVNNVIENWRLEQQQHIENLQGAEKKYREGMTEHLNSQNQYLKAHLASKEKDITRALQEIRELKTDLINGFIDLNAKSKVPFKYQLYKLGTISLCSVLGGLITFLVLTRFWP